MVYADGNEGECIPAGYTEGTTVMGMLAETRCRHRCRVRSPMLQNTSMERSGSLQGSRPWRVMPQHNIPAAAELQPRWCRNRWPLELLVPLPRVGRNLPVSRIVCLRRVLLHTVP